MSDAFDDLLNDLLDYHVDGSWVTSFGPTGYDPAKDFPVCRRAVERLVALGEPIIPRLLALLDQRPDERTFFVAEVLGRLKVAAAAPALERFVRQQTNVARRVNFDQFIDYQIYEPALIALSRIDFPRAYHVLEEMIAARAQGYFWARTRIDDLHTLRVL